MRALAALALMAPHFAAARQLSLVKLDTAKHPLALCNDGSPAAMYVSLAAASPVWVVWQDGGGLCTDEASCKARSAAQRGSGGYAATHDAKGMFDAADPRLAGANVAYVRYCSSDSWIGNATAAEVPFGFNFLGAHIVAGVFNTLVDDHGLGSLPGTQVLYTGCSAGSRGALFNADAVHALLGSALGAKLTRFGAFIDSGFYVDIPTFNPKLPSLMKQMAEATAMTHAGDNAPPACAAAYPGSELWRCFYGQYALPYLKAPVMTNSFLYDLFQLGQDGIPAGGPTDAPARAYCEAFRNDTSTWLRADTPTGAGLDQAVFAPACYHHCCTDSGAWQALSVNSVPVEKALTSWFFGDADAPAFLEDSCTGFACGPGCPPA